MGRMISALALALLITAACCLWCRAEIDAAVDESLPVLHSAISAMDRQNAVEALSFLRSAAHAWEDRESRLKLFLPHSRLEAARESFLRCESAILHGDGESFFTESALLCRLLKGFCENERLTWENLL